MKNTILASLAGLSLAFFAAGQPSRAADAPTTTCKDGTTSSSTGKGTCSGHGGVQKAAKSTAAAPAATPATAPAAAKTTTCKDGTTSTSSGKGTCSSHGGVQKAAPAAAPAN
jgi:hypothetical protein